MTDSEAVHWSRCTVVVPAAQPTRLGSELDKSSHSVWPVVHLHGSWLLDRCSLCDVTLSLSQLLRMMQWRRRGDLFLSPPFCYNAIGEMQQVSNKNADLQ